MTTAATKGAADGAGGCRRSPAAQKSAVMKRPLLTLTPALLLLACGSSSDPSSDAPKRRTADAWCSALPALTTDRRTDLTGKANTFQRVQAVQERYGDALLRCPGVTGHGIGKVKDSKAVNDPAVPPERAATISHAEKDHLISVCLLSRRHRPERHLFLEGVRLEFDVTGRARTV
jgi:hypothetical protein